MQGPLLEFFFENHINNQCEKLLNRADIHRLHVQCDGAKIKDTPLINILSGEVYLPVLFQKIMDCVGHITGGHKKDAKFFCEEFI